MYAESGFPSQASFLHVQNDTGEVDEEILDPSFQSTFSEDDGDDDNPSPDLYTVLGVSRDATDAEIRSAYRRLSRLLHPDKHISTVTDKEGSDQLTCDSRTPYADAEAAFARLTAAYNILIDSHQRAIYDQFGFKGLRIQGWELAVREKSAAELRLEYLLLKQTAKEEQRQHLLQPVSEFSVGVDMTDLFDRYLQESPEDREGMPSFSINEVAMSQSIILLQTLRNSVSLAGQVTAHNGIGVGTLIAIWKRQFSPKAPLIGQATSDTMLSYGRGGYGLGLGVKLHKKINDRFSCFIGSELAQNSSSASYLSILPGSSVGFNFLIHPRISSRVSYRWNLNGGLSSEVGWISDSGERSCRFHSKISSKGDLSLITRIESTVNWAWLNPFRISRSTPRKGNETSAWDADVDLEDEIPLSSSQKGKVIITFGFNRYDLVETRFGVHCAISEFSRLSGEVSASWLQGVCLKLGVHRGTQTYIVPLRLSENWDFSAFGYGVLVPVFCYGVIRSLVYEPWVSGQIKKLHDLRRQRLFDELRKLRSEALATQALMQLTATRLAASEKESNGIVIVRGLYGCLSSECPGLPLQEDSGGPVSVDVTWPLQILVENHQLRLAPGRWADLQGFYDPCAGLSPTSVDSNHSLRQLFVAYHFNGFPHEVLADELAGLAIPMKKHRVSKFTSVRL